MDDREPNDRDGEMDPEDAARWRAARTLADLGELTAQWLEGKIASIPAVVPGCGPGEETAELIPVLAACNRAGYVTTVSRPGEEPVPSPTSWRCSPSAAPPSTGGTAKISTKPTVGRPRRASRPSPVLAAGLAARGTACSLKPLTRSFGRKLRVL